MPRSSVLDINQGQLFVTNEQTGMLHPHEEAIPAVASADMRDPLHDPNPGPAVNILERNAHMQNMLRRLGVMSRTTGLQLISETGQRRQLEARYEDVDALVGSAVEKSNKKHREAKQEYAKAFGLQAIIDSGLMTKEDARAMAARSYRDEVLTVFADAKGADNRKNMKRWLNYQERTLVGKSTRKPSVVLPKPPKVI